MGGARTAHALHSGPFVARHLTSAWSRRRLGRCGTIRDIGPPRLTRGRSAADAQKKEHSLVGAKIIRHVRPISRVVLLPPVVGGPDAVLPAVGAASSPQPCSGSWRTLRSRHSAGRVAAGQREIRAPRLGCRRALGAVCTEPARGRDGSPIDRATPHLGAPALWADPSLGHERTLGGDRRVRPPNLALEPTARTGVGWRSRCGSARTLGGQEY